MQRNVGTGLAIYEQDQGFSLVVVGHWLAAVAADRTVEAFVGSNGAGLSRRLEF